MILYPINWIRGVGLSECVFGSTALFAVCVTAEITVGKDQEVTVKSKGAGGQGKVAAKVTGPAGKPVASKVWHMIWIFFVMRKFFGGLVSMLR